MIARLSGIVADRTASSVVIDVGGVGYLVHVPAGTPVGARGEEIVLHTSLQVREDALTLYGFATVAALRAFELLLGSSGVGPKLALAALSTHRAEVLLAAIAGGDVDTLVAIPGVGRKVADRMVLELGDKVGTVASVDGGPAAVVPGIDGDATAEVRQALHNLGYSTGEVAAAIDAVQRNDPAADSVDTAQLLRQALQQLGSMRTQGAGRG